eukprot:jgi/Tetstr1/463565/TSEL_008444.t1
MRYLHSKGQLLQRELGLPYGLTIEKVRQWWHGVVTPLCAGVRPGKRTMQGEETSEATHGLSRSMIWTRCSNASFTSIVSTSLSTSGTRTTDQSHADCSASPDDETMAARRRDDRKKYRWLQPGAGRCAVALGARRRKGGQRANGPLAA